MTNFTGPIRKREKLAYGLGDFANTLIFNSATSYLMFFYTENLGLVAAQASILLLLARIWDGLIDPAMGIIADRTSSRWGRFRPWILFVSVPLSLSAILMYTVPPLGAVGRLVWAYATHFAMMTCFSAISIPYGALLTAITRDASSRTELSSYRMCASFLSGIILSIIFMPLVRFHTDLSGNANMSYAFATAVCATVSIIGYLICFLFTRERSIPAVSNANVRKDIGSALSTRAWWWLLAMGLALFTFSVFPMMAGLYYLKYVFSDEAAAPAYFACATAGMFAGSLANLALITRVSRNAIVMVSSLISAAAAGLVAIIPEGYIFALCALTSISFFGVGTGAPALWAMVGDCTDIIEHKKGTNVAGFATSTVAFSMKLGLGLGAALLGAMLAATGFIANVEATDTTRTAILFMVSAMPAFGNLLFATLAVTFPAIDPVIDEHLEDLRR